MDKFSKETRSMIMRSVKSADNKTTELALLKLFKRHRIRGWRRKMNVLGRPDFCFPKFRIVIFVDGCFWHGCRRHRGIPKSNIKFWQNKIAGNRKRDRAINSGLRKNGWKILRIWEHEIKKNPDKAVRKITNSLRRKK